ncbi:hypothetical protein COBT_000708 [Conglomerata obtusa]
MRKFDIFNNKEEETFCAEDFIINDFILLAYGDTENKLRQDFIGTSKDKKKLKIVKYSRSKGQILEKIYEHTEEIIHIIPCNFFNTKYLSYVLISINEKKSYNVICKKVNNNLEADGDVFLGVCDRIPILFSHDNWHNSLILQDKNESKIVYYENDNLKTKDINIPRLAINHSSAFIDVDGDLKPELVLVTEKGENKSIYIIEKYRGGYEKRQEFDIGNITGPIVFADFNASGCVDLAYVSKSEDNYHLNILYNLRKPFGNKEKKGDNFYKYYNHNKNNDQIYDITNKSNYEKINLDCFKNMHPILESDKMINSLPTGIFISDLNLNTYPDIILLMKDNNGKTFIRMLENKHKEGHEVHFTPYETLLKDIDGILSVSFADHMNKGKDGIIINKAKNADFELTYIENNIGKDHFKFTALTVSPTSPKKSYGSYVPGISYKYYIDEESIVRIGNQMPQSSFLHLQHPSVFFGLGSINFLVDKLFVGGPVSSTYNEIYSVRTKILPNSDLVLKPYNGGISVELYLSFAKYVKNIIFVFCLVLFINILIVLYSYNKERKKEKKAKAKESFLFNFAAL